MKLRQKSAVSLGVASVILAFTATTLAVVNSVLIRQNRDLRAQLARASASVLPPTGRREPPFKGFGADRRPVSLEFQSDPRPIFVFVYSPGCLGCIQAWPKWQAIAKTANLDHFRLAWARIDSLSTKPLPPQLSLVNGVKFAEVDPRTAFDYNLLLTPEVFEILPHGVVGRYWLGELAGPEFADLATAISQ